MDVIDAGVFVSKWEADVPKHAKLTLWGPLQAKEMGLDGWDAQDGGETGFVFHNAGVRLTMGRATSTLIFVRRLERAFLTIYFGGYPADAPEGQRRLDMQKAVSACELFLTRLAKQPVRFTLQGDMTLVDNTNDAAAKSPAPQALGSGRKGKAAAGSAGASASAGRAEGGPDEAVHVDGAPSWARVPKDAPAAPRAAAGPPAKGKRFIDVEPKATKVPAKGKGEVWEV